jgi:hypothetical protein
MFNGGYIGVKVWVNRIVRQSLKSGGTNETQSVLSWNHLYGVTSFSEESDY